MSKVQELEKQIEQLSSADTSFSLLKAVPQHRSLHFKKAGRDWSARVGLHHRAVVLKAPDGLLEFWIGSHEEYERIVG